MPGREAFTMGFPLSADVFPAEAIELREAFLVVNFS
jgi:hypothetical protein